MSKSPDIDWQHCLDIPGLTTGNVHIWRFSNELLAKPKLELLSAEELKRSARFHSAEQRQRFLANRAVLRLLIAGYTQFPFAQIIYDYGANGKPSLPSSELGFNLAHSQSLTLFAFRWQSVIGVDVELVQPRQRLLAIANKVFNQQQQQRLQAALGQARIDLFYQYWVQQEAVVKMLGQSIFSSVSMPSDLCQQTFFASPTMLAAVATIANSITVEYFDFNASAMMKALI